MNLDFDLKRFGKVLRIQDEPQNTDWAQPCRGKAYVAISIKEREVKLQSALSFGKPY